MNVRGPLRQRDPSLRQRVRGMVREGMTRLQTSRIPTCADTTPKCERYSIMARRGPMLHAR